MYIYLPYNTFSFQIFGIIFTISQGKIIDKWGTLAGNIFLSIFLLIGTVMTGKVLRTTLQTAVSNEHLAQSCFSQNKVAP